MANDKKLVRQILHTNQRNGWACDTREVNELHAYTSMALRVFAGILVCLITCRLRRSKNQVFSSAAVLP